MAQLITFCLAVLILVVSASPAKAVYERALAIFEKSLGPDHPRAELVRRNLAALNR